MKLLKISAFGGLSSLLIFSLQFACLLTGMVISNLCYPQPVTQEWVRLYPDTNTFNAGAYALALDDSGNVYVTGYAFGNPGPYRYCTLKYSSSGELRWVNQYYGDSTGGRFAFDIALDNSSNVYVTGYSSDLGSGFDYCTIKYNSNGVQQWVRYYDSPLHGEDEAEKIAVDNAGNIYVSGYSQVSSGGALAYRTVKYSSDGRELWVQTYPLTSSIIEVNGIKIDDSSRVYITGDYGTKAVTVKYDSSGNQLWGREYAGLGTGGRTGASSISLDKYDNVYIAGFSQGTPPRQSEFFTIKYSTSGVQEWVRRFNTDTTTLSRYVADAIAVDNIGNIYVNGYFQQDQGAIRKFCTIKYTNSGDLIWVQKDTASLSNQSTYMDIDSKSNVYIAGSIASTLYTFYSIIKYDTAGNQTWRQTYEFQGGSWPYYLKIDEMFNIFITGQLTRYTEGYMCTIKYSQPVGIVKNNEEIVGQFKLFQNYPNPFNPATKIRFQVSDFVLVNVKVYDILGREVTELLNEKLKPGNYEVEFDGSNYTSGIYFYTLTTDNFRETKKMVLIK